MENLIWILLSAMVVNNFTLALFLGLCPFMGVSARVETALRMGAANIFVLTITSLCAWFLNTFVLPYAPYLRLISFIVVIASLVQIVEIVIKKVSPTLFRQLGIFLPLITTNCAILGLAIFQTNRGYGLGCLDGLAALPLSGSAYPNTRPGRLQPGERRPIRETAGPKPRRLASIEPGRPALFSLWSSLSIG